MPARPRFSLCTWRATSLGLFCRHPLLTKAAGCAQVPGHQNCTEAGGTDPDVVAGPVDTYISGDADDVGAGALRAGVRFAHRPSVRHRSQRRIGPGGVPIADPPALTVGPSRARPLIAGWWSSSLMLSTTFTRSWPPKARVSSGARARTQSRDHETSRACDAEHRPYRRKADQGPCEHRPSPINTGLRRLALLISHLGIDSCTTSVTPKDKSDTERCSA